MSTGLLMGHEMKHRNAPFQVSDIVNERLVSICSPYEK
ncbi:Uncharacterised protein [Vibrio vulnificus]|nr:Uncharacterised protein [Vibrio vulnificus]